MDGLAEWWRSLTRHNKAFAAFLVLDIVLLTAVVIQPPAPRQEPVAAVPTSTPTLRVTARPTALPTAPPAAPTPTPIEPAPTPIEPAPTPEPAIAATWPEFWDLDFCYALDQIGDANGHIIEGSERGVSFDYDGAVEEAEQAAQDAREAQDALDAAGQWAPAHSVVVYLSSAANELEKAANLLKLGVQAIDVSLIQEAVKHQERATYQINRAATAAAALTAKYGAPC